MLFQHFFPFNHLFHKRPFAIAIHANRRGHTHMTTNRIFNVIIRWICKLVIDSCLGGALIRIGFEYKRANGKWLVIKLRFYSFYSLDLDDVRVWIFNNNFIAFLFLSIRSDFNFDILHIQNHRINYGLKTTIWRVKHCLHKLLAFNRYLPVMSQYALMMLWFKDEMRMEFNCQ